jgi:hypothetical protein
LKNSIKIIIVLLSLAILLGAVSCKKNKIIPTADFNLMLQAQGRYIYTLGVPTAAHYDLNLKMKEINGVGAQLLSVKTVYYDTYGHSYEFNQTPTEVLGTAYISPNQEMNKAIAANIGAALLAEAITVQMTIEFLDDNAHHITKTVQASVQW